MRGLTFLIVGLVLALAIGGVAFAVVHSSRLPTGPVAIAWDKAACAHCQMHVGEPAFACQLQTRGGEVFVYDDPGCLFHHVADTTPDVHATYFHHHQQDRWLADDEVAFAAVTPTPMGYGLGAVARDTPAAISLEDARRKALARQ